ncbi:hypothetical protein AGMMS49936_03950 [Endomicrobiia bacterium]|nr:hypothetical protein AGMMS49936_03950 [Endomicrobiia bacterium]
METFLEILSNVLIDPSSFSFNPDPLFESVSVDDPPPDPLFESVSVDDPPPPDPLFESVSVDDPPPPDPLFESVSVDDPPPDPLFESVSVDDPPPDPLFESVSVDDPPSCVDPSSSFVFALFISSTFSGVAVLLFTRKAFFLSQELKTKLNAINMLKHCFSFSVILLFFCL